MLDILASFTAPITVSNGPAMFGWVLPLVIVIAFVYKATKIPEPFSWYKLIRESVILILTIVVVMALIAATLQAILWLITVKM
ncbi:MAG: hypothetical protein A2Y07_10515 [Planctomycetes bacterium GWF2_50_10]|nr:MAG: hypothetical protein A2Y07_10515 [Planctomycetes bacterium GWF2_50_10]